MSVILRVGAVGLNGNQELHYGSGDEASSSYTDADVLDIPLPEHTYQRPLPPSSSASQTSTGYIGLPYQDHNYGMPPPQSPPHPPSPRPPTPFEDNSMLQLEEEVKTTPLVSVVEEVVEDSITRCICGYLHDDGYMICCDKCSVWQHIDCMGVDRNNIPDSYYCELCQPRCLDALKAKAMQKRKREELAARNVLSDSSATDTDPEEAANALASLGKKISAKKKNIKQKRNSKAKEKPPLKLKIRKALAQKVKRPGKKEKENMTSTKSPKKLMKATGGQKVKPEKIKKRSPFTMEQMTGDPWNSNFSPWIDAYDHAQENQYSPSVKSFCTNSFCVNQSVDISTVIPDKSAARFTCVAEVKKNRKGLRALKEIPAGQAIIEYKGKVILRHDYDKEHSFINCFKRLQPFVLFYSQLDVDLCVDARMYGNEARFVRRSCSPNAEVQHTLSHGKLQFVVISKKNIMCGVEITIPFDYNYQECSYCVECACMKNSCVVSRYWKKLKNSQKTIQKETGTKRKRQSSGSDASKGFHTDPVCMSPPMLSPSKISSSPSKSNHSSSPSKVTSPIKMSSVSTLLAASALLDGQLELARGLDPQVSDSLQAGPFTTSHVKTATSSRRSSRMSEDSLKEEKSSCPSTPTKEKTSKGKDITKSKGKEKEVKSSVQHNVEGVKKERRLSSRRQSQEDYDVGGDLRVEVSGAGQLSGAENDESPAAAAERQKKMTREERKLDAIMKVFEKMEKREERRKEAMARGDQTSRRASIDCKVQKKDDVTESLPKTSQMDREATSVKDEPLTSDETESSELKVEDDQNKVIRSVDIKDECQSNVVAAAFSSGENSPGVSQGPARTIQDSRSGSLDSSSRTVRKVGKGKRRKSRAHSTAVMSDTASLPAMEALSNNSISTSTSATTIQASALVSMPSVTEDTDADVLKFVKTKKHLYDEWSHKHEDDSKKEMFVQCLPNPHVNTMDHLQRRNSQSSGSNLKGLESGGGSAKKRWLRQAMHEVPAPVAFNHSLSVSTDNGSASPVHGSSSPNPGVGLSSPSAGSPLDFVTPLKKRRLMRESLSNEPTSSPTVGLLSESFPVNGVGPASRTNGIRQIFPGARHSTDDRMFLHKEYSQINGLSDPVMSSANSTVNTVGSMASIATLNHQDADRTSLHVQSRVSPDTSRWQTNIHVNNVTEAIPVPVTAFVQPAPSTSFPLKFRGLLERAAVDQCSDISEENKFKPAAKPAGSLQHGGPNSSRHLTPPPPPASPPIKENQDIGSPAPVSSLVVVNGSVYKGVNSHSLMETEGGNAGCVTAKSILQEDSPATVCVDLNAHDIEPPSSLSDSSKNVVVNLDDSLLNVNLQKEGSMGPSGEIDCQVNSSEDVDMYCTARTEKRVVPVNACDNDCTNSGNSIMEGTLGHPRHRELVKKQFDAPCDIVDSSDTTGILEHKQMNDVPVEFRNVSQEGVGSFHSTVVQLTENPILQSTRTDSATTDCISSSEQASLPTVERVVVELSTAPCDSLYSSSVEEPESECVRGVQHNEAMLSVQGRTKPQSEMAWASGSRGHEEVGVTPECANVSSHRRNLIRNVDLADSNTNELSSVVDIPSEASRSTLENISEDNNVDSTSSEARQKQTVAETGSQIHAAQQESFCDSNSDSYPVVREGETLDIADDSSSESLGVSSSEACASRVEVNQSCEGIVSATEKQSFPLGNEAASSSSTVSTEATSEVPQILLPQSPQTSLPEQGSNHHLGESHNQPAESSCVSTAFPLEQQVPSSQISPSPHASSTSPSSSLSVLLPSSSTTSSTSSSSVVVSTSSTPTPDSITSPRSPSSSAGAFTGHAATGKPTSPISSSMEATPVVKKKVSLLEYRKRLKEKPASTTESAASSSSPAASSSSSSSSVPTHHKLSTTLSLFLSGSSPPRPFKPSLTPSSLGSSSSSFSTPSSIASTSSHSSNHGPKRSHMPTLATLPLFKSTEPKKEKKKPKPKPDKPLSLTDRLRLEFGLEDVEENSRKKKSDDSEVVSSNGAVDDSVPPPPPPPLPAPVAASTYTAGAGNGRFGLASISRPLQTGYIGQPMNGTHSGFYHKQSQQPQQSTISSTSQRLGGVSGTMTADQQQQQLPVPPPSLSSFVPVHQPPPSTSYKPHLQPNQQQQPSSSSSSPLATPGLLHKAALPPTQSWGGKTGMAGLHGSSYGSHVSSSLPHLRVAGHSVPQPSHPPVPPPPSMQHFSQRQQHLSSSPSHIRPQFHSQTSVQDGNPPPPPPLPPSRQHSHNHYQSSASSSSHRHQSSSGKSSNSKAASSSSSSSSHSSSSSSRFSDNWSRH